MQNPTWIAATYWNGKHIDSYTAQTRFIKAGLEQGLPADYLKELFNLALDNESAEEQRETVYDISGYRLEIYKDDALEDDYPEDDFLSGIHYLG